MQHQYQAAYESLVGFEKNEVDEPIWDIVGNIADLNQVQINDKIISLKNLKDDAEKNINQIRIKLEQLQVAGAELDELYEPQNALKKNQAMLYIIDISMGKLEAKLRELQGLESKSVQTPSVPPISAIPPHMRRGLEVGARKGSQPPPASTSGFQTATGKVIPSTPPPVPPNVAPQEPPIPKGDKSASPPSFTPASYKPRAGSAPIVMGERKGTAPQAPKSSSPLATTNVVSRSGTNAPPLNEQATTKRPAVADASSAPFKPTPLPSTQSHMIMEKINSIAEQVAAKKTNPEKASEEIAQIIMQMDRDMHASIKMAKDKNFSSVSSEKRKESLATNASLSNTTNVPQGAPKDERLLLLEQVELAKYMRTYEILHFYHEFPTQQKADIDSLKYAIKGSIVASDPLMNEMFEISKRITEIERLEQIEKRENWEKKQKQNDLQKRIENPKNAHQKQELEKELATLIKTDDAEYERKLPIITKLQQEKDTLKAQLSNNDKLLAQRSQDWLAGTLSTNDAKNLKEIIVTKERVVNLWLKVAEILYQNHDYEGLFQVQSVLNELYGKIEKKGQKEMRLTADIILDDESISQLDSYAKLGVDNTYAKDVMRRHIENHENFIPLLAITAPAFITATEMFDPLVKLVKPETNVESLERRATNISTLGKETRDEWQKRIKSPGTDESKKKELNEKLLLSDSEIGKEVLKKKLEATERTVAKVILDTDSFESHLPRTVVLKSETMLSKAKVVELNTGEVVSGVAQRATSLDELNKSLQTMIEIRNKQQPEVEKGTDKESYIGLIDLNRKIYEASDEILKLLDPKKDYEQIKKIYEEKERCLVRISILAKSLGESIDKKNKDKWTALILDIRDKNVINQELKSVAYDNVITGNFPNTLANLHPSQTALQEKELAKRALDLLNKFNNAIASTTHEHYLQMLSNIQTRINLYFEKFKPGDKILNFYKIKLECAILAVSLEKELKIALEMKANPKSITDITKYKEVMRDINEKSKDAEIKLRNLGADVDPIAISIMKKLRHLGDESHSLGDQLLTRATITTSTISQTRTPPH